MKKCPYCAEDIQDPAVVCKHCGRNLKDGTQPALAAPNKATSPAAWGCLTIIVLFALIVIAGQCGSSSNHQSPTTQPPTPATPSQTPAATPQLALLNSTGGESSSAYMKVEGQVQNISDRPMSSVAVVVTWYDKADQFITTDSTLIEYDPLLPGQTSPFHSLTRTNPAMQKYSVAFKHLLGGEIATEDRRKQKR